MKNISALIKSHTNKTTKFGLVKKKKRHKIFESNNHNDEKSMIFVTRVDGKALIVHLLLM